MKRNKPSLKKYILNELAKGGYISRDRVWAISKQFGHTDSTVERTLRPSISPTIEAIKNKNGCITGYKLKEEYGKMIVGEEDNQAKESKIISLEKESVASVLPLDKDTGLQERNVQMYNLRSSETNQGDARRTRNWGQTQLFTI